MKLTTPSEALTKLSGFISRVERLEANNYTDKRFRTADLNKMKFEIPRMFLFASIGVHNKNKERADSIISVFREKYKIAIQIREKEYHGKIKD